MSAFAHVLPLRFGLALAVTPALCAPGEPSTEPAQTAHGDAVACHLALERAGIPHVVAPATRGIDDPVEITGDLGRLRLAARGKRPALMDCRLALALWDARQQFHAAGIHRLDYSAAYDYRTRRHSDELSAHARGLAIDVHVLHGPGVEYVVERDFEPGVGQWRSLRAGPALDVRACIGAPRTHAGNVLRRLVCELKAHTKLCVIVTPDDDRDHRDHLHLEVAC